MSVGVLSAQGACLEEDRLPVPRAASRQAYPFIAFEDLALATLLPAAASNDRHTALDSLAIPAIVKMKVLKACACNHDYDPRHQKQATDCGFPGCPPAGRFQERTGNRN